MDIFRFVDIETLKITNFGVDEKLSKEESAMVKKLQRILNPDVKTGTESYENVKSKIVEDEDPEIPSMSLFVSQG